LEVLQLVISRSSLHIKSESEVVNAVARWARAECKRRGEKESPTACREKLKGVQYLIRYLTLTSEQFIGSPACPPSPLLTEEESDALHLAILVTTQQNQHERQESLVFPDHLRPLRTLMAEARAPTRLRLYQKICPGPDHVTGGSKKSSDVMDKKMWKLQELRERELAFKDGSYSIFDEMFACFRCLFD